MSSAKEQQRRRLAAIRAIAPLQPVDKIEEAGDDAIKNDLGTAAVPDAKPPENLRRQAARVTIRDARSRHAVRIRGAQAEAHKELIRSKAPARGLDVRRAAILNAGPPRSQESPHDKP